MRKLAAAVVLPAIAAGTIAAAATPAQAALPSNTIRKASTTGLRCSGTVVQKKVAYYGKTPAGVLTLYINSRNGGTVYACFTHYGLTKGHRLPTTVYIAGTNSISATRPVASSQRSVVTSNLAGPVALNHAQVLGHCFAARGVVTINHGTKNIVVSSSKWCWERKYR